MLYQLLTGLPTSIFPLKWKPGPYACPLNKTLKWLSWMRKPCLHPPLLLLCSDHIVWKWRKSHLSPGPLCCLSPCLQWPFPDVCITVPCLSFKSQLKCHYLRGPFLSPLRSPHSLTVWHIALCYHLFLTPQLLTSFMRMEAPQNWGIWHSQGSLQHLRVVPSTQ